LFHEPDYEATRYTCSPERLAGTDPGGRGDFGPVDDPRSSWLAL